MIEATIYYLGAYEDQLKILADTMEELTEKVLRETAKRGWEHTSCGIVVKG